ncbi:MAG: saccharopine dehydrogenase NADP-binding domain-containing protein [Gemmatimonadota bacterium]
MRRAGPAIVVVGATGYTGSLVARALSGSATPFVLSARSPDRLERLAARIDGAVTHPVDVTDEASLRSLIRPGDAVINTAGPFTPLGPPVVRACIEAGAHYLDTTGEQPFMAAVHDHYNDAARSAGVAVVPGMAFEYALGDCAASLAADGHPLRSLDVVYAWRGAASSRGTRRTVLRMLGEKAWFRQDGRSVLRPQGHARRTARLANGREVTCVAFGSGEVVTVPRRLEVADVRGWLVLGRRAARLVPLVSPALPVVVPLLRPLLEPLVTRAGDPSDRARELSRFTIRVEAERKDGVRRVVELRGTDPYGITAAIAVAGAERALGGDAPAGVLGPARLVAPGPFLDSLAERGLRIDLDPGS